MNRYLIVAGIGRAFALPMLFVGAFLAADPVDPWLEKAHAMDLAKDSGWLLLLHAVGAGSAPRSLVDDPAFFLAPNGSRDASAELESTLRGLFAGPAASTSAAPGPLPVMDRFPGRAEFLIQRLGINREQLPVPRSQAFEAFFDRLDPQKVVLVFPDAYIGTPASMFGHTLLVIHGSRGAAGLQQAVNYSAVTPEANGILFAIRGLIGSYPGRFSILPYFQKIQEYTNGEHRDLWEYELTLDRPAIRAMLLHLWDHKEVASDYYFFDENCSYQLLFLLDAARPDLRLHQHAGLWVIPADTLRAVRSAGLVRSVRWRPSLAAQVRLQVAEMSSAEAAAVQELVAASATAAIAGFPAGRQALILDTASGWIQALRAKGRIPQAVYAKLQVTILTTRARLGRMPAPPEPVAPLAPDRAHGSQRVIIGGGSDGGTGYAEFAYRPAIHDWMDPQGGYAPGGDVTFAEIAVRQWEDDDLPRFDRLTAIRLQSVRPFDTFFPAPSWTGAVTLQEQRMGKDGERHLQGVVDVGMGLAVGTPACLGYGFAVGEARGFGIGERWSAGVGAEVGGIFDLDDRLRLRPFVRLVERFAGESGTDFSGGMEARWHLTQDLSLSIQADRRQTFNYERNVVAAGLAVYF